MKRIALVMALAPPLVFLGAAFFRAQRADYGWRPPFETPSFPDRHPRVLFDEGHCNASSVGFAGRYWPFGRLLRADGYELMRGTDPFTPALLEKVQVLVIANASGAPKRQFFGINIPGKSVRKRSDPAFTAAEIEAVRTWVAGGGSLLLIADHAPFGESASALAAAFGVAMHKGFAGVPGESDPLLFSAGNGRLGVHPITRGVRRVVTYTGQSLDGPAGASVLLRLPPTAKESVEREGTFVELPAGTAQGLAFPFGKGRVVVLGEAAMMTAQVDALRPFGMNVPGNDNVQFARNALRWLARAL
ncbi:MAG TPA: DUF4350 domain-containing protein [Thermoanaerobaculia bacterium]|nr:DUF4350 domain-containing protein [Thermoanaerobaculia bacterium]